MFARAATWALVCAVVALGCEPQPSEPGATVDLEDASADSGATGQAIVAGHSPEDGHPAVESTVALVEARSPASMFCTGTLVAPRLVVTAAHCVTRRSAIAPDFLVAFGASVFEPSTRRVAVRAFGVAKPQAAKYFPNFDLAWLALAEDAPAGAVPAEILQDPAALRELAADPDFRLSLAGFGRTASSCPRGNDCVGKKLVVDARLGEYLHTPRFFHLMVLRDRGLGACHGDSGGPAYVRWRGKWYLAGATNGVTPLLTPGATGHGGQPRCESGESVYTFVGPFTAWLRASSGQEVRVDDSVNPVQPAAAPPTDAPTDFRGWWGHGDHQSGAWYTVHALLGQMSKALGGEGTAEGREIWFDGDAAARRAAEVTELSHQGSFSNVDLPEDPWIDDLRPIAALPSLQSLHLTSDRVADLAPLAGHPRLEKLFLADPRLPEGARLSLEPLAAAPALSDLGFNGLKSHLVFGALQDGTGAPLSFPRVRALWVSNSKIDSLAFAESFPALRRLTLDRVALSPAGEPVSLAPLAGLAYLERLSLVGNAATFDWAGAAAALPAGSLPGVRELLLGGNRLEDLSFLSAFPNVEELNLASNPFGDAALVELAKLTKLRTLRISGSNVTDLSPLRALPSLTRLEAMTWPLRPLECPIPEDRPGRSCSLGRL